MTTTRPVLTEISVRDALARDQLGNVVTARSRPIVVWPHRSGKAAWKQLVLAVARENERQRKAAARRSARALALSRRNQTNRRHRPHGRPR